MMLTLLLLGSLTASSAEAASAKRVPPYDFGCIVVHVPTRQDCVPWDEARNGTLRGGRMPLVTTTYSIPPIPVLTTMDYTTETGIFVDLRKRSLVRVSAVLRNLGPITAPGELNVEGCLGLVPPPGRDAGGVRFGGFACKPMGASGERTRLVSEFRNSVWFRRGFEPGQFTFYVHLRGVDNLAPLASPHEVLVESISYTTRPFVSSARR